MSNHSLSLMGHSMFRCMYVLALVLFIDASAQAATRLAVLSVESPALANVATFLELKLLEIPDTEALERATIGEILKEQQLQVAFSADAAANRVTLGTILGADVLVLLQAVESPKPHGNLVVFETKRGLRLQVQPFELTADAAADAKAILPNVKLALERARAEVREIVAVPPLVSKDLAIDRQALGKPLATVMEQMLLARPGVAVVELAEAKALADEAVITTSEGVSRQLPLYLLGEFRHDGFGADARMTLSLSLERGTTVIGSGIIKDAAAGDVAQLLRKEAAALIDTVSSVATPPVDAAVEAKQLAERAKLMFRVSAWEECVELAESSLLLKPDQIDLHRLIVDAVISKIWTERRSARSKASDAASVRGVRRDMLYSPLPVTFDESMLQSHAAMAHRASPHLEYFMVHTKLRYSEDMYNLIARSFQLFGDLDDDLPAMMVRVLKAKKASKQDDEVGTFLAYCQDHCFKKASAAERWQWRIEVAEHWPSNEKIPANRVWLQGLLTNNTRPDDPSVPTALKRLKTIDNPVVQQVVADMARRLESGFELYADIPRVVPPTSGPEPLKPVENPEVTFVALDWNRLPTIGAEGWMPVGPGIDAMWGTDRLYILKEKYPSRHQDGIKVKVETLGREVSFDGRFVWAYRVSEEGKPEVIVVDPVNAHVETITAEHGLPPMPLSTASITGLHAGAACVVGHFDGRAWIGLASFDPATGKRSLSVIHEALEQPVGKLDGAWKNAKTAFEFSRAHTLSGPPGEDGSVPQRVFIDRLRTGAGHPLLVDPATRKVEVLESSTVWISGDPFLHDGAMYWAGRTPAGYKVHRLGFPSLKVEVYDQAVPQESRLFIVGKQFGLMSRDRVVWIADDIKGPFRALRTEHLEGQLFGPPVFFISQHFGTIVDSQRGLFTVHIQESAKSGDGQTTTSDDSNAAAPAPR